MEATAPGSTAVESLPFLLALFSDPSSSLHTTCIFQSLQADALQDAVGLWLDSGVHCMLRLEECQGRGRDAGRPRLREHGRVVGLGPADEAAHDEHDGCVDGREAIHGGLGAVARRQHLQQHRRQRQARRYAHLRMQVFKKQALRTGTRSASVSLLAQGLSSSLSTPISREVHVLRGLDQVGTPLVLTLSFRRWRSALCRTHAPYKVD